MLMVKIEATSRQAKILERRVNNKNLFKWMGASKFEAVQLIKTPDAKFCDPLKVIMIEDYTWEVDDEDAVIAAILEKDEIAPVMPEGFALIHIFINEEYAFSTARFETKGEALKYYRAQPEYTEQKLIARVNNYHFTKLKIATHLEK